MPTRKPRVALTLTPELDAAFADLADATGKPASTVVVELLHELIPQLEGLAKVARAQKAGNKAAAKRALVSMVGDSMAELMSMHQPDLYAKGKRK